MLPSTDKQPKKKKSAPKKMKIIRNSIVIGVRSTIEKKSEHHHILENPDHPYKHLGLLCPPRIIT